MKTDGSNLVCQLEKGHPGNHQEIGDIMEKEPSKLPPGWLSDDNPKYKYTIQWGEQVNKVLPLLELPNKNIFSKLIKRIRGISL